MSEPAGDNLLLDLFREEVHTNTQVLSEGLVTLEQEPASAPLLESLMRAAHSVKGAARVVNVPQAVEVAHAMEECFVQSQKGQLTLSAAAVDVLLQGVDTLKALSEAAGPPPAAWLDAHREEVGRVLDRLRAVVAQPAAASAAAPPAARPSETAPPAGPSAAPAAPPAPAIEPAPAAKVEEGVVRLTASRLTRFMGLAGQSLVEARWLQPFAKSLLHLKARQARLAETLESLHEEVTRDQRAGRADDLVDEARRQLDACRELLGQRVSEFDARVRSSDDLTSRLYREVVSSRMRPFRDGVQGLHRLVRDLARGLGKTARLEVVGESTEVDREILDKLEAPLNHLVRNALDHGLETPEERAAAGKPPSGRLSIEAVHRAGMLSIVVSDDGRGVDLDRLRSKVVQRGHMTADVAARLNDEELLEFLFLPGFSTAVSVTEVSGRGVGLDVVRAMLQSVGGHVHVHTQPGQGTRFQLELPVTLSVLRAVIVEIAGEPYAFPHHSIDRVVRLDRDGLGSLESRQYAEVDGRNVGLVLARQVFQLEGPEAAGPELAALLFGEGTAEYGLVVDGLLGEQDLVVRPLDRRLGKVPGLQAAAILDDGSPVLIVDVEDLCRAVEKLLQGGRLQRTDRPLAPAAQKQAKRILVVDDSITVREVQRQLLANRGYEVEVAVDGMDGWNVVREGRFDLVVSDIDMPRLNGLDLVRRMKADPRLQSIPVVIVSYKDRDEDRLKGLDAGANYYLTKSSFHDDAFVAAVQELIGEATA